MLLFLLIPLVIDTIEPLFCCWYIFAQQIMLGLRAIAMLKHITYHNCQDSIKAFLCGWQCRTILKMDLLKLVKKQGVKGSRNRL